MSAGRSRPAYFIDASYFVFRAYHSMPSDMVDGEGNAVHALYGFARFVCDVLERVRPERIGIAFDTSLRTEVSYRNRLYPAYKLNREDAPADLRRQLALCREFCRCLGVAESAHDEFEADDIIGTWVARARAAGLNCVLITRDKDLSQLLREGDVFWDYTGNARYSYHDIGARFGAAPERFADFLALTGDAVDNIPGVPGIGKKTAAALFSRFADLDALYEGLDGLAALKFRNAPIIAAKLREHKERVYLSRKLTGIVCDVPLQCELDDLLPRAPDASALSAFFDRQRFGVILRQQLRRIDALRQTVPRPTQEATH